MGLMAVRAGADRAIGRLALVVVADEDGHGAALDLDPGTRRGARGLPPGRITAVAAGAEPRARQHAPVAVRPVVEVGDGERLRAFVVYRHQVRLGGRCAPPD